MLMIDTPDGYGLYFSTPFLFPDMYSYVLELSRDSIKKLPSVFQNACNVLYAKSGGSFLASHQWQ